MRRAKPVTKDISYGGVKRERPANKPANASPDVVGKLKEEYEKNQQSKRLDAGLKRNAEQNAQSQNWKDAISRRFQKGGSSEAAEGAVSKSPPPPQQSKPMSPKPLKPRPPGYTPPANLEKMPRIVDDTKPLKPKPPSSVPSGDRRISDAGQLRKSEAKVNPMAKAAIKRRLAVRGGIKKGVKQMVRI